jgi:hypothetical protein
MLTNTHPSGYMPSPLFYDFRPSLPAARMSMTEYHEQQQQQLDNMARLRALRLAHQSAAQADSPDWLVGNGTKDRR